MKVVSQWFPARERAFAVGIFNGGSMVGSIIAPPLLVALMLHFGWHSAFLLPGALGLVWVIGWRWVYHAPERHPHISEAELAYIRQDKRALTRAHLRPIRNCCACAKPRR